MRKALTEFAHGQDLANLSELQRLVHSWWFTLLIEKPVEALHALSHIGLKFTTPSGALQSLTLIGAEASQLLSDPMRGPSFPCNFGKLKSACNVGLTFGFSKHPFWIEIH